MLEVKIEELVQAITNLTAAINAQNETTPAPQVAAIVTASEKPTSETIATIEQAVTRDELQSLCIKKARNDSAFKDKVISLLSEYGVKTVGKLSEDKIPEVFEKVQGL